MTAQHYHMEVTSLARAHASGFRKTLLAGLVLSCSRKV